MGWSCSAAANFTLDAITDIQEKLGAKCSNGLVIGLNNTAGFWEASRTEHDDGAITGSVWKSIGNDRYQRFGSFRINANGSIERFPGINGRIRVLAETEAARKFRRIYGNMQADHEDVKKVEESLT